MGKQASLELLLRHLLDEVGSVLEVVAIASDGEHYANLLDRCKLMNSLDGGNEVRVSCHQDGSVVEVLYGAGNHVYGDVYIGSFLFVGSEYSPAEVASDFLLSELA